MSIVFKKPVYTLPNGMILISSKYSLDKGVWLKFNEDEHIKIEDDDKQIGVIPIDFATDNFGQNEYIRQLIKRDLKADVDKVFIPLKGNQMVHQSEVVKLPSGKIILVYEIIELKRSGYRGNNPEKGEGVLMINEEADKFIETLQSGLDQYAKIALPVEDGEINYPDSSCLIVFRINTYMYYQHTSTRMVCLLSHRYTTTPNKEGFRFVANKVVLN